jgi:hypothetical protein
VSAIAWFVVGTAIAGGRIVALGSDPGAWSLDVVAAPLVIGWVALAVLASATHLLPAIGPGDQAAHARQRAILGRFGEARLLAADVGVALLIAAAASGSGTAGAAGLAIVVLGFGATVALLAGAIAIGLRWRRPNGSSIE